MRTDEKTHHGSGHCGAVRFECQLDLAEGTSKCNCSIYPRLGSGKPSSRPTGSGYCREKMLCRTTGSAEGPYITSSAAAAA